MNVIFDMDGLMFDTESVFVKAWDYAGEQMGIGKAGYMTLKTLGMNIAEFGERYNEQQLRKYTKEFLADYYAKNQVPVKKGLHVLLTYLKENSAEMAVASSSPKWEVEKHLRDAKIYEYFTEIVCGDMIEQSKPNPEIYLKACALLNAAPKDTYALEDSKNGLLSAYRAGCKTVMIPDLWQPDEEILQIIIGKFDDLEQVKIAFENGII